MNLAAVDEPRQQRQIVGSDVRRQRSDALPAAQRNAQQPALVNPVTAALPLSSIARRRSGNGSVTDGIEDEIEALAGVDGRSLCSR
jgi:hypothetical protein